MKEIFLVTSACAFAVAAYAWAEHPGMKGDGPHMRQMTEFVFGKMDTDNDKMITKDEARAYADKMFDEADTNHDGKLTMDEMAAQKRREHDEFKAYMGKNTSESSNANKDRAR